MENGQKPLRILIVGAGIGGLTAAIALRQAGHIVDIFEQSVLAQETGAAIHLAPNANALLRRLGLHPENIGAVECCDMTEYSPHNGELRYNISLKPANDKLWTHPWQLVHRAHLHAELKKIATCEEGHGRPASLNLSCCVKSVDPNTATIYIENGTQIQGDLIVGADGVHSRARTSLPGGELKPFDSGKSAFRFLIPSKVLFSDPKTAEVVKPDTLVMWIADDRRLVMYPCAENTAMNFVAIHPSKESSSEAEGACPLLQTPLPVVRSSPTIRAGWQKSSSKQLMLDIFKDFEPRALAILEKAGVPNAWNLLDMQKLRTFVNGRLAAIGDAAHPFLPHQGQGAAMAIEDAVALATVLPLGTMTKEIPERLQLYEKCRYDRAHKIQEYSRMAGMDLSELVKAGKKLDMNEYKFYNFGYDEYENASDVLRRHLQAKDPTLRFRSPLGFGPSPGPRFPIGLDSSHPTIQSLRESTPESFKTYIVKFVTSRTYLQQLLPPGFAFNTLASKTFASIKCTTLDGMTWLGGKGYSHCGLYLHGVECTKSDGSKIFGTYIPILFEDLADPIVTGRDELGMPKLFADIKIKMTMNGVKIALSWRGAEFGGFEISGLARKEPKENVDAITSNGPKMGGPGISTPPPDQGDLMYRYVPAVGEPGKVDAEYAVFFPKPEPPAEPLEVFEGKTASVQFDAGDWQSLPTLHYIARVLAELPVYGIEDATLVKGIGVPDISSAKRVE